MKKLALTLVFALTACGPHEKPNFIYMPDMVYSPAIKAQSGHMLMPPAGTISRDFTPYPYLASDVTDAAVRNNPNPMPPTARTLARGQSMFNTYCIVCHGPEAEGNGYIVPKFPHPPSLQSDKIRGYKDGQIFHVITKGQSLMPSYASQIAPMDRWAIIRYVRALQRAKHPLPEDLK